MWCLWRISEFLFQRFGPCRPFAPCRWSSVDLCSPIRQLDRQQRTYLFSVDVEIVDSIVRTDIRLTGVTTTFAFFCSHPHPTPTGPVVMVPGSGILDRFKGILSRSQTASPLHASRENSHQHFLADDGCDYRQLD